MKKLTDYIEKLDFEEAAARLSYYTCKSKKMTVTRRVVFIVGGLLVALLATLGCLYAMSLIAEPEELLKVPFLADIKELCGNVTSAVLSVFGLDTTCYFGIVLWLLIVFLGGLVPAFVLRLIIPAVLHPKEEGPLTGNTLTDKAEQLKSRMYKIKCDCVELLPYNVIFGAVSAVAPCGIFVYFAGNMLNPGDIVGTVIGCLLLFAVIFGVLFGLISAYLALCSVLCRVGVSTTDWYLVNDKLVNAISRCKENEKLAREREAEEQARKAEAEKKAAANVLYQAAVQFSDAEKMAQAAEMGHPNACLATGERLLEQTEEFRKSHTRTEQKEYSKKLMNYVKIALDAKLPGSDFMYIMASVELDEYNSAKGWNEHLSKLRELKEKGLLSEKELSRYDGLLERVLQLVDEKEEEEAERKRLDAIRESEQSQGGLPPDIDAAYTANLMRKIGNINAGRAADDDGVKTVYTTWDGKPF